MRKEVCLFLIILVLSLPIAEAFSLPVLKEYNNQVTCLQEIPIQIKDVKLSQDNLIVLIESKSNTIISSFIIRLDNKVYYTDKGLLPYNTQYFSIPYSESKQLRVMPRTMYNNKYCNHVMSEEIVDIENLVQITIQQINEPLQVKKTTYIIAGDVIAEKNEITQEINYYHKDNLGSTRVITNQLGNIVYTQNYLPFGEEIQENQDYNAYTGKKLDSETNLYYYGARYYNAKTGRFTSIDPRADVNSPYRYVDNNPLRYVDPSGEQFTYSGNANRDKRAYLVAQTNYFENNILSLLNKVNYPSSYIDDIREKVMNGDILFSPTPNDYDNHKGLSSFQGVEGIGGLFMHERNIIFFQHSHDLIIPIPIQGKFDYSDITHISTIFSQYSKQLFIENVPLDTLKNTPVILNSKTYPIANPLIFIDYSTTDIESAGHLIHEYQHFVNYNEGIVNPIENEFLAYRASFSFYINLQGYFYSGGEKITKELDIETFYRRMSPIYGWERDSILLSNELKEKYKIN